MHMSKLQNNIDLKGIKKNIQIQRPVFYKKKTETPWRMRLGVANFVILLFKMR